MAASSGMSRLCETSASIQAPWLDVARSARASALFLDTDLPETWTLLHPDQRIVSRPEEEFFELPDNDYRFCTDPYWSDALARAGIPTL